MIICLYILIQATAKEEWSVRPSVDVSKMNVFASTDIRNDKLGRTNSGRKSWNTKVTIFA